VVLRLAVAVVSAGADNPCGHPARSTLERLRPNGARVYRTDLDGSVVAEIREGRLRVRAEAGGPVERWQTSGDATSPVAILERVARARRLGSSTRRTTSGSRSSSGRSSPKDRATTSRRPRSPSSSPSRSDRASRWTRSTTTFATAAAASALRLSQRPLLYPVAVSLSQSVPALLFWM
jgi:hypothetical protein